MRPHEFVVEAGLSNNPESNIMKHHITNIILCISLASSAMAGDAWDITRDTFYGKRHRQHHMNRVAS